MTVYINIDKNSVIAKGDFDGGNSHVIYDSELRAFGLDDDAAIKNSIEQNMGAKPQYVWFKNPTKPCDRENMYTDFKWPEVHVNLNFLTAELLSQETKIVSKNHYTYENHSSVPATYSASVDYTNVDTLTHSSTTSDAWKAGASLKVKIFAVEAGVTFDYTHSLSTTDTHTTQTSIVVKAATSLVLQPGQAICIDLICREVKSKVKMIYNASLSGGAAIEYGYWYKNHRKYLIENVIRGRHAKIEETVEMKTCCDWQLKIYDAISNVHLETIPVFQDYCIGE